jgi:CDP-diacylglycerol--glycerol-3-phosphate 3-phosphatidyltransferase
MAPNILTFLRLFLVPLVVALSCGRSAAALWAAGCLFALAAFTDWLDGWLARRRNMITRLGTVLDGVADKMLVLGVLLVFANRALIPLWVVLAVLFRELLVSAVRVLKAREGKLVGANWMGKTKFAMQVGVIALGYGELLLNVSGRQLVRGVNAVAIAATAMAVVSVAFAIRFTILQLRHTDRPEGK